MHQIDADLPNLRVLVKFRNNENACMVIASNKAAADAKNFREAGSFLQAMTDERPKALGGWLLARAAEFEQCESGNLG